MDSVRGKRKGAPEELADAPTDVAVPRAPWDLAAPTTELPIVDPPPPDPASTRGETPPPQPHELDEAYLAAGTTLGEYRVEGKIGEGGMGVVYAAVHPLIGKRAAIKVLKAELCRSAFNVERFVDEARVVNQIGHPNIVDVFAFGQTADGRSYFVMEWLKGESLRDRIADSRLDIDEICDVVKPLARALEAAHEQGVIHRDLKPDNIFLVDVRGEAPLVKLLDFGIAKLAREDHRLERTATGAMVGTPQYIAPEQAKGYAIDHRVDVYALGGILFELLTGRPPFLADNAMEMVAKHLMEPAVRPSSLADVPPELDELVVTMLAKDPAVRPTLADVAAVFDRASALERTSVKTPLPAARDGSRPERPSEPIDAPIAAPRPSIRTEAPQPPRSGGLATTVRTTPAGRGIARKLILLPLLGLAAGVATFVIVERYDGGDRLGAGPGTIAEPPAMVTTDEAPVVAEPGVTTVPPAVAPSVVATPPATAPRPAPTIAPRSAPTIAPPEVAEPPAAVEAPVVRAEPRPVKPAPRRPPPKAVKRGRLELTVSGASHPEILIDGKPSAASTTLAVGMHRVEIRGEGMKPRAFKILISDDKTQTRHVELEPAVAKPPSDRALMEPGQAVRGTP